MPERALSVCVVRGAGLLAIVLAIWFAGDRVAAFYAQYEDNRLRGLTLPGSPQSLGTLLATNFGGAATLLALGLYLTFGAGWLLRRIGSDMTLPRCAACGYDLSGSASADRCPECAAPITATWRTTPTPAEPNP